MIFIIKSMCPAWAGWIGLRMAKQPERKDTIMTSVPSRCNWSKDAAAPGNTAVAFMKYVPKPPPAPVVPVAPPVPTYPTGPDWTVQDGSFRTNAGTNYYVGSSYIIISIAYQRVWAYIGDQSIVDAPVITGRPSMPTPRGLFAHPTVQGIAERADR